MSYAYFSRNGTILPIKEAVMSLDNVAYAYGYGVYENIRLSKNRLFFLDEHLQRLMNSAKTIDLEHTFTPESIEASIRELIHKNNAETCNLKVLLIGDQTAATASLHILCLNPLFPNRRLYKDGATATTYHYEREFPQAKSLNMLPSYLAYRQAKAADAYDALLINRAGNVLEGTRTNFLALQGRRLFSPPESQILPGVTRQAVLQSASQNHFEIIEQDIPLASLGDYDSACLTSTSSKIIPLQMVGNHHFGAPSDNLRELLWIFDEFLRDYPS